MSVQTDQMERSRQPDPAALQAGYSNGFGFSKKDKQEIAEIAKQAIAEYQRDREVERKELTTNIVKLGSDLASLRKAQEEVKDEQKALKERMKLIETHQLTLQNHLITTEVEMRSQLSDIIKTLDRLEDKVRYFTDNLHDSEKNFRKKSKSVLKENKKTAEELTSFFENFKIAIIKETEKAREAKEGNELKGKQKQKATA